MNADEKKLVAALYKLATAIPECKRIAANRDPLPTLDDEKWQPVLGCPPADSEDGRYSPLVWLALSDGRVLPGQALYDISKVGPAVRDWFVVVRESERVKVTNYLGTNVTVVAYMPITTPTHPVVTTKLKHQPK